MAINPTIIDFALWLKTPPGRSLLAWEQARLDRAVADIFGYHALQLGLPELDSLRGNRMPHRWLASDSTAPPVLQRQNTSSSAAQAVPLSLRCDFEGLPFPSQTLDLVILPHTLELSREPHETLREVERVLVPEGRVLIVGFNPASLWGLRQSAGRLGQRLGAQGPPFVPGVGEFIAYRRLRDWLRLLSFEVEGGSFGCWRPPLNSQAWLARWAWLEPAGERWWPMFGAVHFIVAVKRVRGMRLVGMSRRKVLAPKTQAVVTGRSGRSSCETEMRFDQQEPTRFIPFENH
jgi:SAM-dependent methyltransferase